MGLEEVRPPSFDIDDVSIVYDRNSLHQRLDAIKKALETKKEELLAELVCRKEQLQFEHRVVLLGFFKRPRLSEDMKEIYRKDLIIMEIVNLIRENTRNLDALSEIDWANSNMCATVRI